MSTEIKNHIKKLSSESGFLDCGISRARKLTEEEVHLQTWLENGFHGEMKYMENHFDKRLDPTLLMPGAKSVISFLYNYYPNQFQEENTYKISKYAYGEDYHRVIKDKLYVLTNQLTEKFGHFSFRIFVDSAPVMERQWAALSGLGWIGKNSLLLRKSEGSFFFIANIICDLDLEPDTPTTDHCGTCTACIDACPTDAIVDDGVIDARKCLSYLSIELKEEIPAEFRADMNNWIYGCDICQDVCPWNRFSKGHLEPLFEPSGDWTHWNSKRWEELTEGEFLEIFGQSAMTRAGWKKLKTNIQAAKQARS